MSLEQAFTVLYNSSDVEVGTAAAPLRIDPTGTTTQPVSGTVTANQGAAAAVASAWPILVTDGVDTAIVTNAAPGAADFGLVVRVAGSVSFTETRPGTSALTTATVGVASTTILASNANRLGATLFHDSNGNVFVALSATATLTAFTVRLSGVGAFYELQTPVYTGDISGIRSAGSSTIRVTELTP